MLAEGDIVPVCPVTEVTVSARRPAFIRMRAKMDCLFMRIFVDRSAVTPAWTTANREKVASGQSTKIATVELLNPNVPTTARHLGERRKFYRYPMTIHFIQ